MASEKVLDLGDGLAIEIVDIDDLREQDLNARLMEPAMFNQLIANIKKRGQIESLPLCAVPAGSDLIEIVSGHHRIRAARAAGLKRLHCIVDRSGLKRSQIVAKQLAHNAISGFDDPDTLKRLLTVLDNVEDLLESYIGSLQTDSDVDKIVMPYVDLDWKIVTLLFLPHQLDNLKELVKSLKGKQELVAVASTDSFPAFAKAVAAYSRFKDVRNAAMAIALLTETAMAEIEREPALAGQ